MSWTIFRIISEDQLTPKMEDIFRSTTVSGVSAAPNVMTRRGSLLAFALGAAVFTASPPADTADFLRIPFVGSYLITYFDLAIVWGFVVYVSIGKLKLDKREKRIYQALSFVVLTRIISLVFASSMAPQQIISVLRYVETFIALLLIANLLATEPNRRLFLKGVITGVVIDTVGDLLVFFLSGGETRGIWLGLDNYELQVFALVVCWLAFSRKDHRALKAAAACFLLLGITVTETRRAIVLFFVSVVLLLVIQRRHVLKPMLALVLFGALAIVPIFSLFPGSQQAMSERIEQLWSGGGTIGYRIILWEMAATAYLSRPITGIGSGGFARQQNALYFQINDAFAPEYEDKYGSLSTHNTVLGVAAETGTLGLFAYFLWVTAVVGVVLRAIKIEKIRPDIFILAACACLLAMMLEDWWGQASFMAPSTCLLGMVLGWCRSQPRTVARIIAGESDSPKL